MHAGRSATLTSGAGRLHRLHPVHRFAPGTMPGAARMVQNPEDVTPPSMDGPESQGAWQRAGRRRTPAAEERDDGEE